MLGSRGHRAVKLAEKVCCPLLTTVAGRGVVPSNHPLGVGAQLRAPYVQEILEKSDLAVFLGSEFAQTDHWNDNLQLPRNQVWINLCEEVFPAGNDVLAVQAGCTDAAQRISDALPVPKPSTVSRVHEECDLARRQHNRDFTHREEIHWRVLTELMSHIPDNTTVVSDMTQIAYTAVDYLPLSRAGQWLHPTGYGTLGYALPAAIGSALANPKIPVLALVGDAGLQYTMQEMTLAAELGLNLVVLLWNNDALQQICDDMDNAGIARIGIFQKNPDFIALARACHWQAKNVQGLSSLGGNLEKAFAIPGPVLLKLDEKSVS